MKKASEINLNTRSHWNMIYLNDESRKSYEKETSLRSATGMTPRFTTALQEIKDGDKVLDIGCGIGTFTTLVHKERANCEIWGTDISDMAIQTNRVLSPTIHYLHQYIGRQDMVPENYFDVVFAGEVLEHLSDPNELFKDAYKSLKTGGKFIITTPNEENIRSEEHVWFFTKEDIDKLYVENGFSQPDFVDLPDMEYMYIIFAKGVKK